MYNTYTFTALALARARALFPPCYSTRSMFNRRHRLLHLFISRSTHTHTHVRSYWRKQRKSTFVRRLSFLRRRRRGGPHPPKLHYTSLSPLRVACKTIRSITRTTARFFSFAFSRRLPRLPSLALCLDVRCYCYCCLQLLSSLELLIKHS